MHAAVHEFAAIQPDRKLFAWFVQAKRPLLPGTGELSMPLKANRMTSHPKHSLQDPILTTIFFALLLIVVLLASWVLTLLGMPGNWLMVMATATYAYFVPVDSPATIGWKVVMALAVLASLGEILELLTATAGTVRAGGSRRGAGLALLGSMIGGLLGSSSVCPFRWWGRSSPPCSLQGWAQRLERYSARSGPERK